MGDFNHAQLDADFGYIWCRACEGQWEGPEDPTNSPCSKEAQAIRDVIGHTLFLMSEGKADEASEYIEVCRKDRPLAFYPNGQLKEIYWKMGGNRKIVSS